MFEIPWSCSFSLTWRVWSVLSCGHRRKFLLVFYLKVFSEISGVLLLLLLKYFFLVFHGFFFSSSHICILKDQSMIFKLSKWLLNFICTHLYLATFMSLHSNCNTSSNHWLMGGFPHILIINLCTSKALSFYQGINYWTVIRPSKRCYFIHYCNVIKSLLKED